MDTAQWPQGIGVVNKAMESARPAGAPTNMLERRARPQKEHALNCPRCNSTNTKFCYYNNYSLSQPRYFCKTCRRYWTEGGSLRNVPVGGGSRKNKRPTPPSSAPSSSNKKLADLTSQPQGFSDNPHHIPKISTIHAGQDLNLGYPQVSAEKYNAIPHDYVPYSISSDNNNKNPSSTSAPSTHHHLSAMEMLKSTGFSARGLSSFSQIPVSDSSATALYSSSGFGNLQDYKPGVSGGAALNFSLEGFDQGSGYGGSLQGAQVHDSSTSGGCRLLFPFEDLKQPVSSSAAHELEQQNRGHNGESTAAGYWNGMLGGGPW